MDSLIKEYDAVKDELKAGEVGLGSLDVRAAFSQLAALAATFCQKSKDKDQKKEVSDTREAKQASHTELQMQAAKVQKELSDMRAAGASAQRQSKDCHETGGRTTASLLRTPQTLRNRL